MIRNTLKTMGNSKKVKPFLEKYSIPVEYLSVNRKMTSKAVLLENSQTLFHPFHF